MRSCFFMLSRTFKIANCNRVLQSIPWEGGKICSSGVLSGLENTLVKSVSNMFALCSGFVIRVYPEYMSEMPVLSFCSPFMYVPSFFAVSIVSD